MAKKTGDSCLAILIKMTFLLTIMAILGISGIYFTYNKLNEFFNRGGTIVVPDFRGKHLEEVMRDKPKGIEIVRRDERYDANLPKDHVIAQFPEPNTVVKPGKQVMLSVSLGFQRVIVPDLIGNAIREVDVALLNAQLGVGNRAYIFSNTIAPDRVVGQSPMPSEEYGINRDVDLLISLGNRPKVVPLPDLSNMSLESARASLRSWGLSLGRVYSTQDKKRARFRIISTNPPPYSYLRKGDTVNILVSSGFDLGSASKEELKKFEVLSDELETVKFDMSGFKALVPMAQETRTSSVRDVREPVRDSNANLGAAMGIVEARVISESDEAIGLQGGGEPTETQKAGSAFSLNLAAPEKQISYMMPDGFMPKELKLIHVSQGGRKQLYAGVHKPLELVRVKVPVVPNAKVQVYINDIPIEELKVD